MTAFLAAVGGLTGLLKIFAPIFTAFVGWLIPSPFQSAAKQEGSLHADETKAQDSRGNVANLDNLP